MKLHLKRVISSIVMNPLNYYDRVPKIRGTSKRFPSGCGIAKWFPFCMGITKIFQTQFSSNNGITKRFPLKSGTMKNCDSVPVTNGNRAKNGVRFPLLTGIGLRFRDRMRISGILKQSIFPCQNLICKWNMSIVVFEKIILQVRIFKRPPFASFWR